MYIFLLLVLINIISINFIYYPEILYYFVGDGTKIFDDVSSYHLQELSKETK